MKIIVCTKQVPDVEVEFHFKSDLPGIEADKMSMIINPGDEVAIEGALRLKSIYPDIEVILVSLGPPSVRESLEYGLSMGADRAVHIQDTSYTFGNPFRTAHILSKAISEIGYDMVLFGYKAVDDRLHFVGPAVAEFLNPSSGHFKRASPKEHIALLKVGGVSMVDFPLSTAGL